MVTTAGDHCGGQCLAFDVMIAPLQWRAADLLRPGYRINAGRPAVYRLLRGLRRIWCFVLHWQFAEVFGDAMLGYALPLTAVTLVIVPAARGISSTIKQDEHERE
jgi:hypothetical protein